MLKVAGRAALSTWAATWILMRSSQAHDKFDRQFQLTFS